MTLCEKCLFLQDDLGNGWIDCIKKGRIQQKTAFCEKYIFRKVLIIRPDYVKKWDDKIDL